MADNQPHLRTSVSAGKLLIDKNNKISAPVEPPSTISKKHAKRKSLDLSTPESAPAPAPEAEKPKEKPKADDKPDGKEDDWTQNIRKYALSSASLQNQVQLFLLVFLYCL
jgi:hypothetical protein